MRILARRAGLIVLIMMPLLVVGLVAIASRRIESKVLWRNTTSQDAFSAALQFVRSSPGMRGASNFSQQQNSVVERWGPTRWRVAGYVDIQPAPGAKVRTLYSCVLHYDGQARWAVEDFHFERIE
jgi:hypothetical protein